MFLQNKYTTWYYRIINNAISRADICGYVEKHHIMPRSLGGDNNSTNIARLTAREHFICHMLLPRMTEGMWKYKMAYAAKAMTMNYTSRYVNSRLYEYAKRIISANGRPQEVKDKIRQTMLGIKHTKERNIKVSEALRGKKLPKATDERKAKISAANKGRKLPPQSEATRLKRGQSIKESWASNTRKKPPTISDETRLKKSISMKKTLAAKRALAEQMPVPTNTTYK